MKLIDISTKTYPNLFAQVDDEDFEELSTYRWFYCAGYAARSAPRPRFRGSTIKMHGHILKAVPGQEIDHIDGDPLNNQRNNLRFCSHQENIRNQAPQRVPRKSRFKGVSKVYRKWVAYIKPTKSKMLYLGLFDCENCAAAAYNLAAKKYFGEFARLNEWEI
jgi:hypothetical protein